MAVITGNLYDENKIFGEDGKDVITGGVENDYIDGGNGSDTLYGGAGDDTIKAGTDKPKNGVYYENFIDGGQDNDKLYAGGGIDTFYFGENFGKDTVYSANQNDKLYFENKCFYDLEFNKVGNNLVIRNYNDDNTVTLSNYFKSKDGQALDKITTFDKYVYNEEIDDYEPIEGQRTEHSIKKDARINIEGKGKINGTSLNDIISTTSENTKDTINGGDGDDEIYAYGGNDTIYGGAGDDYINAGWGNNTIYGGDGDDTIFVGEGNDKITGGNGENTIIFYAGTGSDTIYLTKDETLHIDYCKNDLIQESKFDIYEKGNDLIISCKYTYGDEYNDYKLTEDTDTITIKNFVKNIAKKVAFYVNPERDYDEGTLIDAELLIEDLYAYVYEQGCGGRGTKRDDNFTITLGEGITQELNGISGGTDTIKLNFAKGKEYGEFTYSQVKETNALKITYTKGDKTDTVIVKDYFSYDKKGNLITKSSVKYIEIGDEKFVLSDILPSGVEIEGKKGVFTGTMFGDVITGTESIDKIYGKDGNDIINGGYDDDYIDGGNGDDVITGAGEDDYLDGGNGDDVINGGSGVDTIIGGNGDDVITGGLGNDEITGGKGSNTIIYNKGDGNDTIYYTKGEKLTINYFDKLGTLDKSNFNIIPKGDNTVTIYVEYENIVERITIKNFNVNNLEDELIFNLNPIFDENGALKSTDYSYYSLDGIVKSTKGNDTLEVTLGEGKEYVINGNSGGTDTLVLTYDGNLDGTFNYSRKYDDNFAPTKDLCIEYYNYNEYGEGFTDKIIIKNYFTKAKRLDINTKSSIKYIEINDKKYLLTDVVTGTAIDYYESKGTWFANGTAFSDWIDESIYVEKYKIYGKNGNDYIKSGWNNDYIDGGNGSDELYGGAGNDTIKAGTDAIKNGIVYENYIEGGLGDDKLYAGGGKDTFHFGENSGDDIIYSANSDDVLTFDNTYNFDNFKFEKEGNSLVMHTGANSSVELSDYFKSKDGNVLNRIIDANGQEYLISDNDTINVNGKGKIYGTILNDNIVGSDTKDTIYASEGKDTIIAGLGDDYIDATKGKNTIIINKGDGDDTILVGANGETNIDFKTPKNFGYNLSFEKIGNNLKITRSYYDKNDYTLIPDDFPTETTILKNYFATDKNGNYIQPNVLIDGVPISNSIDFIKVEGSLNKANKIDLRKYDDFNFNVCGGNKNDKIYLGDGNHKINSGAGNDDVVVNNDGKNTYYYTSGSDEYDSLGNSSDDYNLEFSSKTNLEIEDNGGNDSLNLGLDTFPDDICFCFDITKNGSFAGDPDEYADSVYLFRKDALTYENVLKEIKGKDMQGVIEIKNATLVGAGYQNGANFAYGMIENLECSMLYYSISDVICQIAENVVNWLNSSENTKGWDSSMEVFASGNKEAIESLIGAFTTDITWTPINEV